MLWRWRRDENMKNVILIGDSIRLGYEETVRSRLAGLADVWAPTENGGTSKNVLAHLDEWVLARSVDLVHLNCGLHDMKKEFDTDTAKVPLNDYAQNVRYILERLRDETEARVAWASITPVNEEWHHRIKGFDRFESDVQVYNAAASAIADELGIVVNDLFSIITTAGRDDLLLEDGVHFKPEGCTLLGESVANYVKGLLA